MVLWCYGVMVRVRVRVRVMVRVMVRVTCMVGVGSENKSCVRVLVKVKGRV